MIKVSVIGGDGVVEDRGEWDGERKEEEYAFINGRLYHCAYVYLTEHEKVVCDLLVAAQRKVKAAKDEHLALLMQLGHKYRARA